MDMDLFARVRERLLDGTLWPLTNDHVIGALAPMSRAPSVTRASPVVRPSTRSPA